MRVLDDRELPLVKWLLKAANFKVDPLTLSVESMNDGGMGGLVFTPKNSARKFGRRAAECYFIDGDGVLVSATLNLDKFDNLFEMDVWRVDFSPLVRWPCHDDIAAVIPNLAFKRTGLRPSA